MVPLTGASLRLPATAESIASARHAVHEAAASAGAAPSVIDDAILATSEAVTNVVHHAYEGGAGMLTVAVSAEPGRFHVVVVDEGCGFDRGRAPGPRAELAGHFGLVLIELLTLERSITSSPESGTTVRMSFALPVEQPQLEI